MIEMIAYRTTDGRCLCREPKSDFYLGGDLHDTNVYMTSVDRSDEFKGKRSNFNDLQPVIVQYFTTTKIWKEFPSEYPFIVHYERVLTQVSSYQITAENEEKARQLAPPLNGGVTWTTVSSDTSLKPVESLHVGTPISPEPSEGMMGERYIKKPGWITILWDNSQSVMILGPFETYDDSVNNLRKYRGAIWDGRVQRCSTLSIHPDLEHIINLEA